MQIIFKKVTQNLLRWQPPLPFTRHLWRLTLPHLKGLLPNCFHQNDCKGCSLDIYMALVTFFLVLGRQGKISLGVVTTSLVRREIISSDKTSLLSQILLIMSFGNYRMLFHVYKRAVYNSCLKGVMTNKSFNRLSSYCLKFSTWIKP